MRCPPWIRWLNQVQFKHSVTSSTLSFSLVSITQRLFAFFYWTPSRSRLELVMTSAAHHLNLHLFFQPPDSSEHPLSSLLRQSHGFPWRHLEFSHTAMPRRSNKAIDSLTYALSCPALASSGNNYLPISRLKWYDLHVVAPKSLCARHLLLTEVILGCRGTFLKRWELIECFEILRREFWSPGMRSHEKSLRLTLEQFPDFLQGLWSLLPAHSPSTYSTTLMFFGLSVY